jgi:hypothetical protein
MIWPFHMVSEYIIIIKKLYLWGLRQPRALLDREDLSRRSRKPPNLLFSTLTQRPGCSCERGSGLKLCFGAESEEGIFFTQAT